MSKAIEKNAIHPACPRKLRRELKREGYNMRNLARALGVNIYYVSRAINHGERPSNEHIARALFFAREYKRREPKEAKPILPRHLQWWKYELTKENRNAWINHLWVELHPNEKP